MGRGAQNLIQGGKFLGNEGGNLFQGLSLQGYQQIITTGNQINCMYLRILVNALRHTVKALSALRCHTYLNQRIDSLHTGFLPVDQGVIATDDSLCLQSRQLIDHINLRHSQNHSQFLQIHTAVFLNNTQ